MRKRNLYQVLDNGYSHCEFYSRYFNKNFYAKNDKCACKRVEKWQNKCMHEQINTGVKIDHFEPCMMLFIIRYDSKKDEWINVTYNRSGKK